MSTLTSSRTAIFAAFRTGGLVGVVVRPSRLSSTGLVVAPVFATLPAALRFAARAAVGARHFPAVRPVARRGGAVGYAVSLPLAGPVPAAPVRFAVRGLRGPAGVPAVAAALAALGV